MRLEGRKERRGRKRGGKRRKEGKGSTNVDDAEEET